jgi:hypothetical protein
MDIKGGARRGVNPFAVYVALCLEEGRVLELFLWSIASSSGLRCCTLRRAAVYSIRTGGTCPPAIAYDLNGIMLKGLYFADTGKVRTEGLARNIRRTVDAIVGDLIPYVCIYSQFLFHAYPSEVESRPPKEGRLRQRRADDAKLFSPPNTA